ncbi:hypothetical protein CJP74_03870 [Psittacicella melopsittaci]|uniref:Sel1 repeat family protein n=1 Tax=Psittacicella melopsittaci TaxID=2028576 RepID=A0A3A1Y5S5_9GAMM|nr:SEL1-like repeat protein [Psittacicella melopsittaci]RIY32630.1 hypothetical protein CJP74_03870 [Psittacicella melopsittaci]
MSWIHILVVLLIVGIFYNSYKKLRQMQEEKAQKALKEDQEPFPFPPDVIDLYNRAYNYETGYNGLKSMDKAIEFYTLAAQKEYPAAMYRLADIYAHGKGGVEVDYALARKYATQAAAREYPGSDALYQYICDKEKSVQELAPKN